MYYPKSQIKPNLYTNGKEYSLSTTGEEYIGFYYELVTGQKFTGKYPNDGTNIQLISSDSFPNKEGNDNIIPKNKLTVLPYPGESDPQTRHSHNNFVYSTLPKQQKSTNRNIPVSITSTPSSTDYRKGVMQRYFAKRNNQNIYLEISVNDHTLLQSKSSQIAWDLYTSISLPWYIQGESTIIEFKNILTIKNAARSNRWPGFSMFFSDYLQFHLAKINFD